MEEVRRAGAGRLRWTVRRGGEVRRWETDVVENVVGERIVWVPTAGDEGESLAVTIEDRDDRCLVTMSVSGVADTELQDAQARVLRDLEALRDALAGASPPPAPPRPGAGPGGGDAPLGEALGAVPVDPGPEGRP